MSIWRNHSRPADLGGFYLTDLSPALVGRPSPGEIRGGGYFKKIKRGDLKMKKSTQTDDTVGYTIKGIPRDLMKNIKMKAYDEGRTVKDVVIEAMTAYAGKTR